MAVWAGIRTIEHRRIVSTWIYINVSYHYANVQLEILVGMTNTTKVLADKNLAVQYWNAIHVQCHNIGGYKDGLPNCQI